MKVLQEGPTKTWSTEATCTGSGNGGGGCGAKLLVEATDLFLLTWTDMGGDSSSSVTFRCPLCRMKTDLQDVPGQVTRTIRRGDPERNTD